jgi:hypothetical protein
VITAIAPTYPLMLIGSGIAACFVPIAALVFVAVRELFPARRVAAATGIIGASAGGIVALVSRAEMGVASGMSLMLIGLMTTVGIQVAFTVLNRHWTVLEGIALYNDTGYSNAARRDGGMRHFL